MKENLTTILRNKTILFLTPGSMFFTSVVAVKCIYSAFGTILLIPVFSGLKLKFNVLITERPMGNFCTTIFSNKKFYALPRERICMFRMVLKINSEYFSVQN